MKLLSDVPRPFSPLYHDFETTTLEDYNLLNENRKMRVANASKKEWVKNVLATRRMNPRILLRKAVTIIVLELAMFCTFIVPVVTWRETGFLMWRYLDNVHLSNAKRSFTHVSECAQRGYCLSVFGPLLWWKGAWMLYSVSQYSSAESISDSPVNSSSCRIDFSLTVFSCKKPSRLCRRDMMK